MSEAKFKVGDRVRTANYGNGYSGAYEDGIEFTITEVVLGPTLIATPMPRPTHYYMGDPNGWGVWENRLELATDRDAVTNFASEPIGTYIERYDGIRYIKVYEDQWRAIVHVRSLELLYSDAQMQLGRDYTEHPAAYTRLIAGKNKGE